MPLALAARRIAPVTCEVALAWTESTAIGLRLADNSALWA
jgi:hypothetical protein